MLIFVVGTSHGATSAIRVFPDIDWASHSVFSLLFFFFLVGEGRTGGCIFLYSVHQFLYLLGSIFHRFFFCKYKKKINKTTRENSTAYSYLMTGKLLAV